MFQDLIERLSSIITEQSHDHHQASAHATERSKSAEDVDGLATQVHYDPYVSSLEKHDNAIDAAHHHGEAELAHLHAAKQQYKKGNEELAHQHLASAKHHREQHAAWMGGAHEAHLHHRELEFQGQLSKRGMHKERWNKSHPYDFEKWTAKEAEGASKHADGVEPWSPRHRDAHDKAAKHWGAASEAARDAAEVTGPGTEDHSYYSMRADHANVHHLRHKQKSNL